MRLHNGGICDDTRDSEIPNACGATLGDQDIPLDIPRISTRPNLITLFITHRVDITVYDT